MPGDDAGQVIRMLHSLTNAIYMYSSTTECNPIVLLDIGCRIKHMYEDHMISKTISRLISVSEHRVVQLASADYKNVSVHHLTAT